MMADRIRTNDGVASLWYPDWDVGLPIYRNFENVSREFLEGYRMLVERGMVPATVAFAMLSATVNLYEMFDMKTQLPGILRATADRLEEGAHLS